MTLTISCQCTFKAMDPDHADQDLDQSVTDYTSTITIYVLKSVFWIWIRIHVDLY